MKATNIKWDTDGNKKALGYLPKEMEIPSGMYDIDDISDYLSDETGFCHDGFCIEYDKEDVEKYLKDNLEEYNLDGFVITNEDVELVLRSANSCGYLMKAADSYLEHIYDFWYPDLEEDGLESEKEDLE